MSELIDFFISFFNNQGCKIKREENFLIIEDIPLKFEKFSGKTGPYFLSFEKEKPSYELVTSNHYLVNAIKEFLSNKGETTLLKVNFDLELKEALPKIIPFTNSTIKNISKTSKNEFIYKFSFSNVYFYLNEKETMIHNFYLKDGKVISLKENLKFIEGNKGELFEKNIDQEYSLAKEELRKISNKKIEEISEKLDQRLDLEIKRINLHYENKLKEFKDKKQNLEKQIESNKEDKEKIKRLKKNLENLEEQDNIEKIKQEEQDLIQGEIKKHGLKIENKLINTAIIYYPIYSLNLTLEIEKGNYKIIELTFDPYENKIKPVYCKNCGKELREIIVCSSGHLTCRDCGEKCISCGGVICKQCQTEKCAVCGIEICSKCAKKCDLCYKYICPSHLSIEKSRKICNNCSKKRF